ncbi:uncharacterized protein LOC107048802 [Diachasma alloeum]|uniref:uncharacterized protein LOC107048802 n=1 Tax=Diachasma alloeum TaxID=454923 RepID=UPI0007384116|nr:uncharacterized protein LOC107048802 [Diachasma alloeum]
MDKGIALDCTVRSQESNVSDVSKNSGGTGDSKTESCRESKHSKVVLIPNNSPQERRIAERGEDNGEKRKFEGKDEGKRSDGNVMMLTSCGQLLLGLVLVVFGVLVLVHGVSLGSSGAGLWAGAAALIAGALGLVATLADTTSKKSSHSSGFATAHLASSLVALALSNMSTITALTAIVRDLRSTPDDVLLLPSEDGKFVEIESDWGGLLASIGLLLSSLVELLLAGYTCVTLTPKLCGCLSEQKHENQLDNEVEIDAVGGEFDGDTGKLKTRNMVHQWVIAQTHTPKTPPPPPTPFYVVHQPMVPLHPMIQAPYGGPHGKYPAHYIPTYGPVPIVPHLMASPGRPPMQMYRSRRTRYPPLEHEESSMDQRRTRDAKNQSTKPMTSIDEDENVGDLARTYTGLDKKISEEFISICMDPERKSKASSHHGSEIGGSSATKNL